VVAAEEGKFLTRVAQPRQEKCRGERFRLGDAAESGRDTNLCLQGNGRRRLSAGNDLGRLAEDHFEWQIEWQSVLAGACHRLPVLVCARVLAGQPPDLQRRNAAGVNGKEKVYGSIP
jgi:hypothetical protein